MHGSISSSSARLLPDGTPLQNGLLASLPADASAPITEHLQMQVVVTARTLQEHGTPVTHVSRSRGASPAEPQHCVQRETAHARSGGYAR